MLDLTSSSLPVTNLATPPYALSQQPVKVSHHYNVALPLRGAPNNDLFKVLWYFLRVLACAVGATLFSVS